MHKRSLIYKSINLPTATTYLLWYTVQRLFIFLLIYLQTTRIYCHYYLIQILQPLLIYCRILYNVLFIYLLILFTNNTYSLSLLFNSRMWARHLGQIKHMYS